MSTAAPGIRGMAKEFYWGARGTLIIGLGYEAQSGKDTVAEHLVAEYGRCGGAKVPSNDGPMDIQKYAIADTLKAEVFDWLEGFHGGATPELVVNSTYPHPGANDATKFGWGIEEKAQWVDARKEQLRAVIQRWGDYRRAQNEDYFTDRVIERIAEEGPRVAIISDLRLPDEPGICHVTIKVQKYGNKGIGAASQHRTETSLRNYRFDYTLGAVAGDTDELKRQAERVFEDIVTRFRVQ